MILDTSIPLCKSPAERWRDLLLRHDALHDAADQPLAHCGDPQPPFSSKLLAMFVGTICDDGARAALVAAIDEEVRAIVRQELQLILSGEAV